MTSSAMRIVGAEPRPERRRLPLLEQYLKEQRELTAVERFARQHADAAARAGGATVRHHRELLPASPPAAGQQYAFEVDLDACTGCKACVTACHNLNGLDDGETWRHAGLLHGGSTGAPVRQTVTAACHHCLEPACMHGCPVSAYEKDAKTGIVKHLDDQCIGCQYCTFMCPYDVPQYNAARGIVRKCDMCSDRLAEGEAPACVQGCPNQAISITVVEQRQALEDAQGGSFVPGAAPPGITIPTTLYRTERVLPRNLLPANFYDVAPSHRHIPLVVMLVLTQLSVGAFVVDTMVSRFVAPDVRVAQQPIHCLVALAMGLAALGASMLHLGRPLYAFRALLGLRTSWMSREILAFGLFAPLAVLDAAWVWRGREALEATLSASGARLVEGALAGLVGAVGIIGIGCSALIYHATRRAFWSASNTGVKFLLTAIILGLATTIVTLVVGSTLDHGAAPASAVLPLTQLLVAACVAKLGFELLLFQHLRDRAQSELKRTAIVMIRDLRSYAVARFAATLVGGVVLPLVHASAGASPALAGASLLLVLAGELLERTLFFAASPSPGMPGGVA